MTGITIRPATMEDLEAIARLYADLLDHLQTHENYPGWKKDVYPTREDARRDILEGTEHVAMDGGRIIGAIVLNREPEQPPVRGGWRIDAPEGQVRAIHRLAVHPAYGGRGVGRALLTHAEDVARTEGAKVIRLDVYEGNTPAIAAYERQGYVYIDTIDLGLEAFGLKWFRLYEKIL